jgi:hypothetical protein
MKIPLQGCRFHCLSLAVQEYFLELSLNDGDAAGRQSDEEVQQQLLLDELTLLKLKQKIREKAKKHSKCPSTLVEFNAQINTLGVGS